MTDRAENDVLRKPVAPNACPVCKHTPRITTRCFGIDSDCVDWRGDSVPCICANDVHFEVQA